MAVTPDSFTEGRLRRRLGAAPARRPDGSLLLAGANLARMSLTKAQFAGADLRGCSLAGCDLTRAVLRGADLRAADLGEAKLHQAELDSADLRGADLRRAVISGASLIDSRWAGARLDGAHLRDLAPWRCDLRPENVLAAATVELGDGLETCDPDTADIATALEWCIRFGDARHLQALAKLRGRRTWKPLHELLDTAGRLLQQRLGGVNPASLSRVAPEPANPRSLSHAEPSLEVAWRDSLARLRARARRSEP